MWVCMFVCGSVGRSHTNVKKLYKSKKIIDNFSRELFFKSIILDRILHTHDEIVNYTRRQNSDGIKPKQPKSKLSQYYTT